MDVSAGLPAGWRTGRERAAATSAAFNAGSANAAADDRLATEPATVVLRATVSLAGPAGIALPAGGVLPAATTTDGCAARCTT